MADPQHRSDSVWKDAEALIERVEIAARGNIDPASFFDDLVSGLRLTTHATAVTFSVAECDHLLLLARSGVLLHAEAEGESKTEPQFSPASDESGDFASHCHWSDSDFGSQLKVSQRLQSERYLHLDFCFDEAVELGVREPLGELSAVLLDLAAPVVLRDELTELRRRVDTRTKRDMLIRDLNQGIGLSDSFASIASVLAATCRMDRVSLLQYRGQRFRLVTTSARQKVARRARQIRLMERMVDVVTSSSEPFSYEIGSAVQLEPTVSDALEPYINQSGCREIHIRAIREPGDQPPSAALVVERFQAAETDQERISHQVQTILDPLEDAVRGALRREDSGWGFVAARLMNVRNRRRLAVLGSLFAMLVLAACFVPMELRLPVEGRIEATRQSRLFAPSEGIVSEIPVENGSRVNKGDVLVTLRSPALDLQRRTVEGTLATAQTRLASLTVMRSRGGAASNREREAMVAAEEQVIQKEIEGLNAQLELLRHQQASLTITSPMDGLVDRWDLTQSLQSRPVSHGQYLLDVISESDGWTVDLDIPEKNVNYVLKQQQAKGCHCTFRLRSDPTKTYEGEIEQIAEIANLQATGQSIVHARFSMESGKKNDLRDGATVIAQVECGQYPLGFVAFRSLIQWYRSNPWF